MLAQKPVVRLENCYVQIQEQPLLNDISLTIYQGQHTAIMGGNGAGKSLLMRLLMRDDLYPVYNPESPPVLEIMGEKHLSLLKIRQNIGVVSGRIEQCLIESYATTVYDAVLSGGAGTYGFFHQEDRDKVPSGWVKNTRNAIEIMELKGLEHRSLSTLSTGQLRRVMVARALSYSPPILFLDEPTAGLDIVTQRRFVERLRSLTDNVTIILITHYPEEIFPEMQNMIFMQDGKIMTSGLKEDFMTDDIISKVFDANIRVLKDKFGYFHFEMA